MLPVVVGGWLGHFTAAAGDASGAKKTELVVYIKQVDKHLRFVI